MIIRITKSGIQEFGYNFTKGEMLQVDSKDIKDDILTATNMNGEKVTLYSNTPYEIVQCPFKEKSKIICVKTGVLEGEVFKKDDIFTVSNIDSDGFIITDKNFSNFYISLKNCSYFEEYKEKVNERWIPKVGDVIQNIGELSLNSSIVPDIKDGEQFLVDYCSKIFDNNLYFGLVKYPLEKENKHFSLYIEQIRNGNFKFVKHIEINDKMVHILNEIPYYKDTNKTLQCIDLHIAHKPKVGDIVKCVKAPLRFSCIDNAYYTSEKFYVKSVSDFIVSLKPLKQDDSSEDKNIYVSLKEFQANFEYLQHDTKEECWCEYSSKCQESKRQESKSQESKVDHPSHYTWLKDMCGIEVIDITRHLDFDKGNAVKYLLRSGYKSEEGYSQVQKEIEDLKKAKWYIEDKIKQLEKES